MFTGKSWSYSGDLLFRLGSYRDRQRPAKLRTEGREQPEYITVRLLASGVPVALQKGAIYRVHGYLQSWDHGCWSYDPRPSLINLDDQHR